MASQEVDGTEPGAARTGNAPGSQGGAAGEDSSAYRPLGRSQNHPEVLQVLGVSQPQVTPFFKVEATTLAWGTSVMSLWRFLSYSSLARQCALREDGGIL